MNGLVLFPSFFKLSLNFAITISSRSYSSWLYRASPSLTAENIINLILVLTIWWCPCVELPFVFLEKGVYHDQCVLLNSDNLCLALFCTPRPNLPFIPAISWLPTFAFQSPVMKRTSFLSVLVLEGVVGLHRNGQLQLTQHQWLGKDLDYCDVKLS